MKDTFSPAVVEFARVWGGVAAIVVAGVLIAYRYVGAPPPTVIRIATGSEDGAYYQFAKRYASFLAADGITLETVPTAGSRDNLERLRRGDVTLALVQGGTATEDDQHLLQALGSLFLEPVWVFTPASAPVPRLTMLTGARVGIGDPGSGTALLATRLLDASGVNAQTADFVTANPSATAELLEQHRLDAAFFVAAPRAAYIQHLVVQPSIRLFEFTRATAFSHAFPYLTPIVINEGVLNLRRNIPPRDITVLATVAALAARQDLHPALVPAILDAVTRVHQAGGMLERRRQFPSTDFVDLPLNEVARRYIEEGPSFLYRWLPYGAAVLADRLKILLLPLLALLVPLVRVAPPLYQWRIRSRIYRWYTRVRELDERFLEAATRAEAEAIGADLKTLERDVASVVVPLAYTGELYNLRLHIRFLQEKLEAVSRSQPQPESARER